MRLPVLFVLILIPVLALNCGGGGGGGNGGTDSTAPTAVPALSDGSVLGQMSPVILTFSESMDTGSLTLSGDVSSEDDGGVWTTTVHTDDTLTISPSSSWTSGVSRSLTVDAKDLAGNAMSTLDISYDVRSGTFYYVSQSSGADTNDGLSPSTPKRTIMEAVGAAPAGSDSAVLVAGGSYLVDSASSVATQIAMKEEVSLYGGFAVDFTSRDPILNVSSIADQGTSLGSGLTIWNRALEVGGGITTATVIDGFSITGGAQVGDFAIGVYMNLGSVTLRNNTVDGGEALFNSYGIIDFSSASVITGNTVSGGTGPESAWGILANDSTAVISGNSINGGIGSAQSLGITCSAGAAPTITDNLIDGGASPTFTYGVQSLGASPILTRNTILGGAGTSLASWGVAISSSGSPVVRNNAIRSGNGSVNGYGIVCDDVAAIIQNNTVSAASSLNAIALNVFDSAPTIENNILSTTSGLVRYCIRESNNSSDPAAVRNNDLFDCPTALYYDEGSSFLTSIIAVNGLGDTTASGNVSVGPAFASTMDFHLTVTSPALVTEGALDLSGSFTTDRDSTTRTAPWSMGAYEQD